MTMADNTFAKLFDVPGGQVLYTMLPADCEALPCDACTDEMQLSIQTVVGGVSYQWIDRVPGWQADAVFARLDETTAKRDYLKAIQFSGAAAAR